MTYVTADELIGYSARDFDEDSPVSVAQLEVMLTEWSNKLDGLADVDTGHFGTDATAPRWAKEAVKTAVSMKLENIYDEGEHTEVDILNAMKAFMQTRDRTTYLFPKFPAYHPDSQGNV